MKAATLVRGMMVLVISLAACQLYAQDADTTYWKKKFKFGLNLNQASFSSNWVGGGVNSIGFNSVLVYKANYKKGKNSWDNLIDLGFGIAKIDGQGTRKSVDFILLDTKYGRELSSKWNFFTSLNFISQFAPGYAYDTERPDGSTYDSLVSKFMAPAYLTSSWGFEYVPTDYFSLRLAPFAPRFTFVTDDEIARPSVAGPYGLEVGDNIRAEWLAFQMFAQFDKDLSENINLKWSYILYLNYENLEIDQWDHRLDLTLSAKVHEYVDVSFGGILLYDFDQVDELQVNQFFTLGFAYTIQNYEEEE